MHVDPGVDVALVGEREAILREHLAERVDRHLADVRVVMHEKNGRWLVRDAEATQAKPGQP
jgi:hypothetical protein